MVNPLFRSAYSIPRITLTVFILLVTSCTQATPNATLEPIRVKYSFATQPWLTDLNTCVGNNIVSYELCAIDYQDPQTADLIIRFGLPDELIAPGYLIGTDNLMVIVNSKNPENALSADQVRGIFTGRIQTWKAINGSGSQIQVWVYSSREDVQQIFDQSVLGGSPVTSLARLAYSPDEMSQAISIDVNAIGLLAGRWKTGDTTTAFTAASNLPVLAITQSEPQGALVQIIACLQN